MNTYVTLRGAIYVSLAMLAAFSGWLNDLTAEAVTKLSWIEWAGMAVAIASSGLISLRAFIDGSAERNRNGNGLNQIKP